MAGDFNVFGSLLGNAYMKEMDRKAREGEGKRSILLSAWAREADKDTHGVGT